MCSDTGHRITQKRARRGFPIRRPWDHSPVIDYPRLIADSHVLHRLLMPRHPPCALENLTTKDQTLNEQTNKKKPQPQKTAVMTFQLETKTLLQGTTQHTTPTQTGRGRKHHAAPDARVHYVVPKQQPHTPRTQPHTGGRTRMPGQTRNNQTPHTRQPHNSRRRNHAGSCCLRTQQCAMDTTTR